MSAEIIATGVAIAFLAGMGQSFTGFGFTLVWTPLVTLAWEVKAAITTGVILGTVVVIPLLVEVRTGVSPRRIAVMLMGYAAGIAPGVFLLETLDASSLRVMVAVSVIAASLLLYLSPASTRREETMAGRLAAGAVSGSIHSSTSLGGPPVALYLLGRGIDVASFRATMLVLFLPANLLTVMAFALVGRITEEVMLMSAAAVPAVLLGVVVGAWLRRSANPERFRSVVLAFLVITSAAVLVSAVGVDWVIGQ